MKNPDGFLSIQLGIGWLAGRLRPVSAPEVKQTKRREK
jgi:hypothetical protein